MLEGNAMFESLQDLERVLMPKKEKNNAEIDAWCSTCVPSCCLRILVYITLLPPYTLPDDYNAY